MRKTPPFITPFAILSIIILLGTTNVVENKVTHTQEGGPVQQQPTRMINNQNRQPTSANSPANSNQGSGNRQSNGSNNSNSKSPGKSTPANAAHPVESQNTHRQSAGHSQTVTRPSNSKNSQNR